MFGPLQYMINFIVADYRGYGLSDGDSNKENLLNDSKKIFQYVKSYLNDNKFLNKILVIILLKVSHPLYHNVL